MNSLTNATRATARAVGTRNFNATATVMDKIVYTDTDEAPYLATYALLPIINRFTEPCGVPVELSDISVAARVICHFPENLTADQRVNDNLADLGVLATKKEANTIKLPNVSASIPQLQECIAELQSQGYDIPDYPTDPKTDAEIAINATYSKVLGSAVNPVLREGNSDRRVAAPVKAYAQKNPHRMMKPWGDDCKAFVKHMSEGDFFASEQSHIMPAAGNVKITFTGADGSSKVLKEGLALEKDELISGSFISASSLRNYFEESFQECADKNLLLSMHLKATMMKISDPIIFGHAVEVFYKDVFAKHGATFEKLGVNVNNGLGDVYEKIESLDAGLKAEIEADLMACYKTSTRPAVSMVDSRAGITNFHVPSDVIIDASMPNVVRDGGKMWNVDDELEETMALVPDRCYAGIYREALDYCRKHGQFDVATMGNVANVGLMAKKAEEYGSHDKTFEMESAGTVSVTDASGAEIFSYAVGKGDVWRMSQTKNDAIEDWVKLAVNRARATGDPAVFWLNPARAHDTNLINLCNGYLKDHDTNGLDIRFMTPEDGINMAMERCTAGTNTITVTGNVLRDYLTDLFPILELGTSAKMLSIVPLLNGGALYETGAGGSAPKHVQQLVKENHLRWDSLGEYLALAVSLEDLADRAGHVKAGILGKALNQSIGNVLNKGKSPSRKVGEIDNRGSSFYLALYWAEALTEQTEDLELAAQFQGLYKDLTDNEEQIAKDLIDNQGGHAELGGYYKPNRELTTAIMRPSATLNAIIDARE